MSTMWFQRWPRPTVDVIIPDRAGRVLVITRGHAPFFGTWCLPGGMIDMGETIEQAALREVEEEVGLSITIDRVVALRSSLKRDPRGHFISVVLLAHPVQQEPELSEEATDLRWALPTDRLVMAFDHAEIMADHWRDPTAQRAVLK